MEEFVKIDDMGQWSIEKADVNTDSMTKPQMVGHINKLNQSGKQGEARRLYDKHISGGGAATKDVGKPTPLKKEEEKSFQQKLKDIKTKYKVENESKEADPAKTNTNIATADVKRKNLAKSNYGPKDMKMYSQKDNIQRKMKNTGDEVAPDGSTNRKTYIEEFEKSDDSYDIILSFYDDDTIDIDYFKDTPPKELNKAIEFLEKNNWSPKSEHKSKSGGLTQKGVESYRRANPGSKLKTAVTEKKPKGKRAKRRKSFCARNKGQIDMHNIDCRKDPKKRACLARKKWKCKN